MLAASSRALRGLPRTSRSGTRARLDVRAMAAAPEPKTAPQPGAESVDGLRNAGPDPKRFTVADGQMLSVASAAFAGLARLGTGGFAQGYSSEFAADDGSAAPGDYAVATVAGRRVKEYSQVSSFKRPEKPIEIYEFKSCPFCKKVREAVSILDLDVTFRPSPKGGSVWRSKAVALGGKAQFPFLVDANSGKQMYESDAIIAYLFDEYGPGAAAIPAALKLGFLTTLTCGIGLAPRAGRGGRARPSKQPAQELVLWGYELSPFVSLVQETLGELELPYKQVTCSRGSPKRAELLAKRGHFQVPYLEDPNQGVYLFESAAICKYLEDTYALPAGASSGSSSS